MNNSDTIRANLKTELLQRVEALGQQSLLPSEESVTAITQRLEQLNPILQPLRVEHRVSLVGEWQLIYASRGTVVTRQMTDWMGVAIERVWQTLTDLEPQKIAATNGADLMLPILGTVRLQAQGSWIWNTNAQLARVAFETFSVQAVAPFNQSSWKLPEVAIPVLEWFRNEAIWQTSYLDPDLRIGRGATGNLFVFRRCHL